MGYIDLDQPKLSQLIRPALLIEAARIGALRYRRARDLATALPEAGMRSQDQIVTRLAEAERVWESLRRSKAPGYRPASHVQVLSAYLAETAPGAGC